MTKPEVEDSAHWFNQYQTDLFHEILDSKISNPNISCEVGRYAALSNASGPVRQYAPRFVILGSAYSMLERISSKLTDGHTFKTTKIASNKVEITVMTKPDVQEKPCQCKNRIGMFESVAKLFPVNLPRLNILHVFIKEDVHHIRTGLAQKIPSPSYRLHEPVA